MALPPPFNPQLKVLVLAGANTVPVGDLDEASHEAVGEIPLEAKSFLHLRGRLVIEYVLDWLHEAGLLFTGWNKQCPALVAESALEELRYDSLHRTA